jgi:hypothetical protein
MPLYTCQADESVVRKTHGKFQFPLGVYPVEDLTPREGYVSEFEPADGGDESGEWEEWPDRYVFDVVVSAEKLQPLCRQLFAMMPARIYPILDILGRDAFREIDPHISYELVGLDVFFDGIMRFKDFLYEDGLCGFGAMSESPFFYVFVDEHKIVTIRIDATRKERLEKLLEAFDLEATATGKEPVGADGAAHEHRTVLSIGDNPKVLGPEEVIERLRDEWRLVLNVDPETNVDDDGTDLGLTQWRCVVRCDPLDEAKGEKKYAEVILDAENLRKAEEMAVDAVGKMREDGGLEEEFEDQVVVCADRLDEEGLRDLLGSSGKGSKRRKAKVAGAAAGDESGTRALGDGIRRVRWL